MSLSRLASPFVFATAMALGSSALAEDASPTFEPFAVDPQCVYDKLTEFAYDKRPQTGTIYRGILDDQVYTWKIEINMEVHFTKATQGLAFPTVERLLLEYNNDNSDLNWETSLGVNYTTNSLEGTGNIRGDLFELDARLDKCRVAGPQLLG